MGGCILGNKKKLDGFNAQKTQNVDASRVYVKFPANQQAFAKQSCPIQSTSPLVITLKQKILPDIKSINISDFSQYQWKAISCPHYQNDKLKGICKWSSKEQDCLEKQALLYSNKKNNQFLIGGVFSKGNLIAKEKYFKIFNNGAYFIGELNNSFEPDGYGELHTSGQQFYIGNFNQGVPHGLGKKKIKDRTFQGTFKRGEIIKGKQISQRGAYEGTFKNNKKHGRGILRVNSGLSYDGQFQNNKKEGEGTLTDKQGNIKYKGTWSNDKPKNK